MLTFISGVEKRKLKYFIKKILESLHLKLQVYKILILPSQEIALHHLRKIVKNFKPLKEKNMGKKIVFNSVDGRYTPHTYLEGGIAKALQIRGHEIKMLVCGGAFCKMCAAHFTVKKPPNQWDCNNCIYYSRKFYETTQLPYSTYKEYLEDGKIAEIKNKVNGLSKDECLSFVYKNINVGYHAKTSADRYFVGAPPEKQYYEYVLRSELTNAMISTDVAEKVLIVEKPDVLVTSHGCYSSWGSFSDYFINKGIKSCIWFTGYKKDSLIFDLHKIDDYFKKYYIEIRKKMPLNKQEEEELNLFLNNRIKGVEGDTAFYEFSDQKKDLFRQFNFNIYHKNYAMFPNVAWDASIISDINKAFSDIYEWVSFTIDFFKKKPILQLIIKIHPAEVRTNKSEKTMLDYINEKYDSLPDNIKIIPPDTNISAYSLFPYIDAGIMYTGTLCLEMALKNIPVIMIGKSRYSDKGFVNFVSTKKEYLKLLKQGPPSLSKKYKDLVKVYAYFYFIKSFVPRRFIYYKNFLNLGWNINSFNDLLPGKDKYLDHLCNYIVYGGIYQDW